MTTTQSKDPNERVNHPRHYNQHSSGIECIEIIEHLPCNLANAVKYIWRCGLKQSTDPLRDLRSAEWYVRRELARIERFGRRRGGLTKGDVAWRELARQIIDGADGGDLLAECLDTLLQNDPPRLLNRLEREIRGAS